MKWSLSFCLILLFAFQIKAQEGPCRFENKFTPKTLKEDCKVLIDALKEIQPSLYRYTNKKEMDEFLERIHSNIIDSMTEMEFYAYLLPVIARVKNGHSRISPSSEYLKFTEEEIRKFPLKINIFDGHAYVKDNFSLSLRSIQPNLPSLFFLSFFNIDMYFFKLYDFKLCLGKFFFNNIFINSYFTLDNFV